MSWKYATAPALSPAASRTSASRRLTSTASGEAALVSARRFRSTRLERALCPVSGFQGWQFGGGAIEGKPSVSAGMDGAAYVAGRDSFNAIWLGRVPRKFMDRVVFWRWCL